MAGKPDMIQSFMLALALLEVAFTQATFSVENVCC